MRQQKVFVLSLLAVAGVSMMPAGHAAAQSAKPGSSAAPQAATALGSIQRISVATNGTQGNQASSVALEPLAVSTDGRYVAFSSYANTLAANDGYAGRDVFVRDRIAGTTELISIGLNGQPANAQSYRASISADGRYVAFLSEANNLVAGDGNGFEDVFVRDRVAGTTEMVNLPGVGGQSGGFNTDNPQISADGRYVVWQTYAPLVGGDVNGGRDIYLRDRATSTTERITVGLTNNGNPDGHAYLPVISGDGRYVAFQSTATNLVAQPSGGWMHIYLRDRAAGTTQRVDLNNAGDAANNNSEYATISGNGRLIGFTSYATNLAAGDSSNLRDVYLRDVVAGTTEWISHNDSGAAGTPPSSAAASVGAALSADGRFIAFSSDVNNLVPGDTDARSNVFVRNRQTDTLTRVSLTSDNQPSNGSDMQPVLSADGRYVVFGSTSDNLVPNDSNGFSDVFLRARIPVCTVPFSDVPGTTFAPYITNLYCMGIVEGYGDNTFRPGDGADRGTLARWLVKARGWAINTSGGPHFTDVQPANPLYPYVETAVNHGVMGGYADGTFKPTNGVTRGQMSKMVINALGWPLDTSAGQIFRDVDPTSTFYAYIDTMVARGLVGGYSCGTGCSEFRPNDPVSRGQLSKVINNAIGP
jgi:Tol biopolymer transport system component